MWNRIYAQYLGHRKRTQERNDEISGPEKDKRKVEEDKVFEQTFPWCKILVYNKN